MERWKSVGKIVERGEMTDDDQLVKLWRGVAKSSKGKIPILSEQHYSRSKCLSIARRGGRVRFLIV